MPASHDDPRPAPPSRRGFLGAALASGLVVPAWLAACKGDAPAGAGVEPAPAPTTKADHEAHDAALLAKGLLLEQGAINVYAAAAGLPFIADDPTVLAVAGLFKSQHEAHRDALAGWIRQLGGEPPDPKTAKTPDIPKAVLDEALAADVRKVATLELARKLEMQAAEAYFSLVTANLLTDFARRAAAEILPVEAQHVAVYDVVLGRAQPVNAALFSEVS